jgi:hypothetical protein
MQLDLRDEETLALLNLLVETIEADKFPLSPRVQILRAILAKFGPLGPAPPSPARPPTPEERDPRRAPFSASPSVFAAGDEGPSRATATPRRRSTCTAATAATVTFEMAELAVPRRMFQQILRLIDRLRAPPAPA